MGLTWWWLTLIVLLAVAVVAGLGWWFAGRDKVDTDAVLVAHTRRLTRLPAYQAAVARQRARLLGLGLLIAIVVLPLAVAAGRPGTTETIDPEKNNRDIMLCLDVSGSMIRTDKAVLEDFAEIVKNFRGERIGLVLWNNQAVTAFPLTDDYDLVEEQLTGYADGFSIFGGSQYNPTDGTFNERIYASSLSGDGLASCVYNFDHLDQERPRAIILGTDNEVHGQGVYTIDEAAALAKERKVRVYGLNPMPFGSNHTELSAATEETGGRTWGLDQPGATDEVTSNIDKLEAARLPDVAPVHVRTDLPAVWLSLGLLGLLGLYPLLWWWRR
ncbi:VWA domain-containing protein [Janibacter limosus]|uniref:VWA domain-containing protein n=1 Tax=Janibacter limosus TaxID=53458 RepID=UPI000AA50580|nr:VWA domain-containing protein [Janibacter limosus]